MSLEIDENILQQFAEMNRNFDGSSDATKTRWSPTANTQPGSNPSHGSPTAQSPRDNYAQYGAGAYTTAGFNNLTGASTGASSPSQQAGHAFSSPLYSTPTTNGSGAGNSVGTTQSPLVAALQQSQQQQSSASISSTGTASQQGSTAGSQGSAAPYAYNMLNMGLPNLSSLNMFGYNSGQLGSFGQNFSASRGLPSLNVNIPQSPSAYSPVTLSSVLTNAAAPASRTVYIGNLPSTASVDELLNLVHFGPLENIRVLPDKSCVFLSFLDANTAAAFNADAMVRKLSLHNQELKIGWGKPSPVPPQVALAISQNNASRNVYLGGLDESQTEEALRDDLQRFGLIDQVKIVRDKSIGFVHFLSIAVAIKVVTTLPTEAAWSGKRVNYGKDRCAYIPKSQQAAAAQAQAAAAQSLVAQQSAAALSPTGGVGPFSATPFTPSGLYSPFQDLTMQSLVSAQALNRTVYLGNVHPDTTTEDLCNAIRGGVLQSIRYMADKHIAFVTFVDPAAAFTFYQVASYQGLTLNNRRLKIGWGKNSGPLPPALALAVHSGATRNVYVGNIEDFETFTIERLKTDFSEFGDIELVNYLKEKNAAFVNFTNISSAIKAIDAMKSKPEYASLRIAHGKDRCANAPRSGPQGGSGPNRRATGGPASPDGAGEGDEIPPPSAVEGVNEPAAAEPEVGPA